MKLIKKYGFGAKAFLLQRYYGRKYRGEIEKDRKKIVEDIAEYTGTSQDIAKSKIEVGEKMFRVEWNQGNPQTPSEVLKFYEESDWLIYELAYFNYFGSLYAYIGRKKAAMQARDRTLDYGGGIGTISLMLSGRGLEDVTHYELSGKTMEFARWRFNKRCPNVVVIEGLETEDRLDGLYGTIVCLEVIEHLKDPALHLRRLTDHLAENGKLYITASFGSHGGASKFHFESEKTLPELLRDVGLSSKYPIFGMWAVATK